MTERTLAEEVNDLFERLTDPASSDYDPEFTDKLREAAARDGTFGIWFPASLH